MAERERIAREMHDGMAQVLGVTHLRLRALESAAAIQDLPEVHDEVKVEPPAEQQRSVQQQDRAGLGLGTQARPRAGVEAGPRLQSERTMQAGSRVQGHGAGLEHDGARTAHGIEKRKLRVVSAQSQNARGQGFAQGSAPSF